MPNNNMPTIAEFAATLGVSKSTVVNKLKDLDLPTVADPKDKRGRRLLPAATCSALADKLAKSKPLPTVDDDRLFELFAAQVEPLKAANASLRAQVDALLRQVEQLEKAAAEQARAADERASDLRAQVARLEEEKAELRRQADMARALEGFHWPWTRDRIRARYLLPEGEQER